MHVYQKQNQVAVANLCAFTFLCVLCRRTHFGNVFLLWITNVLELIDIFNLLLTKNAINLY